MRRQRSALLVGLVVVSLGMASCGSRRPLSDFAAGGGPNDRQVVGAPIDPAAVVPGGAEGRVAGERAVNTPGAAGTAGTAGTTATTRAPGSTGLVGSTAKPSAGGGGGAQGAGAANVASDVGVTATTINLGNIVTKSGAFGPDQFTPFYYGAAAFFSDLNARGGVNGRKVVFNTCDDAGTDAGNDSCARSLVDQEKVFALVANTCLTCAGLKYAASKAVPSVGGLAIDSRDYALPHSWRSSGNPYPQNGSIGYKGQLYKPATQYKYFKDKLGIMKAGVVYYDNTASSKNAGLAVVKALQAVGIEATGYGLNVALPNYDSAVIDMKSKGITALWDAIDIGGNQNLCKSIDSNALVLSAKVSTISTWAQTVGSQFKGKCRTYIYSVDDPGALTYDQVDQAPVAAFRAGMKRYFPSREGKMFQWNIDGWASAMWFTDAARSCGADLTRFCLEKFLDQPKGYTAGGLWWPRNNNKWDFENTKSMYSCIAIGRWSDEAMSFKSVDSYQTNCNTSPLVAFTAPV